jgi:hypothetical protein
MLAGDKPFTLDIDDPMSQTKITTESGKAPAGLHIESYLRLGQQNQQDEDQTDQESTQVIIVDF